MRRGTFCGDARRAGSETGAPRSVGADAGFDFGGGEGDAIHDEAEGLVARVGDEDGFLGKLEFSGEANVAAKPDFDAAPEREAEFQREIFHGLGALVAEPLFLLVDSAFIARVSTTSLAGLGLATQIGNVSVNASIYEWDASTQAFGALLTSATFTNDAIGFFLGTLPSALLLQGGDAYAVQLEYLQAFARLIEVNPFLLS